VAAWDFLMAAVQKVTPRRPPPVPRSALQCNMCLRRTQSATFNRENSAILAFKAHMWILLVAGHTWWARLCALQNAELLAQHEDLQVLRLLSAPTAGEQVDQQG